LHQALKGLPSP